MEKIVDMIDQPLRKMNREIIKIKKRHSRTMQRLEKSHRHYPNKVSTDTNGNIMMKEKLRVDKLHMEELLNLELKNVYAKSKVKNVVIDFSCVNGVDSIGVETFLQLKKLLNDVGILMHFSCLKSI
jgi:hypothetical protein